MSQMKAYQLHRYGKSDQTAFTQIPTPTVKPNEILVKVHAVGLNPIDNAIPSGAFKAILKFKLPHTMGSDLAGEVVKVGREVTRFKKGDAIYASVFGLESGALAEFVVLPEITAALKPTTLDFVQAASIPMVGLTSWQALKIRADLKAEQKVFISAGSGGIGTFAIQLAKYLGAKVGTTTSTDNVELVKRLGADDVIDYRKQNFENMLLNYDVALVTLKDDVLVKSLSILKPKGRVISLVGPPDSAFARTRGMNFVLRFVFGLLSSKIEFQAKKRQIEYSFLFVHPDGNQLSQIRKLIDDGIIQPIIDRVFQFEEFKEALVYLEQGRAKGKVVVKLF
jgi:NADPH:quinone reductase-like Zn-dependent oxidoreductase